MLIFGTRGPDELYGTAATDTIFGRGESDLIFGSPGGDLIFAGAGDDKVRHLAGGEVVYCGDGADGVFGDFASFEAHGGSGDGVLTSFGPALLYGDRGNDILQLAAGRVEGGAGNDSVSGRDQVPGYEFTVGHTDLVGGRGADMFGIYAIWNDINQVTEALDFRPREGDRIELFASYSNNTSVVGGTDDPSTTIAGWLDVNHDRMLDARDEAAGAGVHVDPVARTVTLDVFTDALVLHGSTALSLDWIV